MERILMKILQNSKVGVKHKIAAAFPFSQNYVFWNGKLMRKNSVNETGSLL